MPDLSRTVQRAALLDTLRRFPVPTIPVETWALLRGISRSTAYDLISRGEVEVQRDGRKVTVLVAPMLEQMGFPASAPTGPQASDVNVLGAWADALGATVEDVAAYNFARS